METILKQSNIADMYPLSPMQKGMLFHAVYDAGSTTYLEQLTVAIEGALDPAAFERAWNGLIDAHPVLRTVFRWRNLDEPAQVVLKRYPLKVEVVDLRGRDETARRRALEEFLERDRRTPLALETGPLMRVSLLRHDERRAELVWTFHHILFDGWSLPLLIGDLLAAYEALRSGGDYAPSARRPFRDYIAWLKRQDPQPALAFWSEQLRGFSARTPLPLSTRAAIRDFAHHAEEYSAALDPQLARRLRATARELRVTPNALFQCAWSILLARLCGQSDVVHGTTLSGRPADLPGAEGMVGQLTQTLPVRVRVDAAQTAGALAQSVHGLLAQMQEHEWIDLPRIRALTPVKGDESLFETLFVFENYPLGEVSGGRASLKLGAPRLQETTNFPLAMIAGPAQDGFALRVEYAREVYDAQTIARLFGYFERLLGAIAAEPSARVGALALLPEQEERRVVADWNATAKDYARGQTIHGLFEAQAQSRPAAIALVFEEERLSYAELNARANRLAHRLRALGVGPEACVALCAERSAEMVVGLLAILKAGGAYLPLDPAYPRERLEYMLENARPAVVLAQRRLLGLLPQGPAPVVCPDDAEEAQAERGASGNPEPLALPDNLAYVIYTSGSTGRPKGVMVTHRGISNRLVWMQEQYRLTPEDRILQKTPYGFDVSVWEFFWPLMYGARLVVARPEGHKDSAYLAAIIREAGITTIHFVPSMLQAFMEGPELESCASLRRVICSGEALPPQLQNRFLARSQAELHNLYGPTEASVDVSYWHCAAPEESTVPIGRPIANTQLYVLDARLEPVPVGVAGELYIGGVGVARGYLNRPGLTAERFVPDRFAAQAGARLYRTGDLARWRSDGSIEYLGRNDFQVKIRGFRIELGEIEAALLAQPDVREAVVVAHEYAAGDKRLVAYLGASGGPRLDESALRAALKARLPEYMVPSRFVVLERLPLTVNGKVDRKGLPEPEGARPQLQTRYEAPRGEREGLLAGIWQELLRVERVGRQDNFFDLGGDSILSLQIVARLHRHKLSASPKLVFEHQTIAELALRLQELGAGGEVEQAGVEVPLTPIQRWFFELELERPAHWNHALLLGGGEMGLEARALERALQGLLEHHDALRLGYRRTDEGWVQYYRPRGEAVAFTQADLSGEADPVAELARRGQRLHESLDLERGPLLRAGLFHLGAAGERLLLVLHHLVVDGVSWRILLEDLAGAYGQALRGEAIVLAPKSGSFQAWGRALERHARSAELQGQRAYWERMLAQPVERIEAERAQGADTVASIAGVRVTLGAERTAQLLGPARAAYRTEINELLLVALMRALKRWRGVRALLIDVEGHGREGLFEGLELSRTVGWFTSLYPVRLELGAGEDLGRDIVAVKQALRAVPDKGVGYGVLRYLAREPGLQSAASVSFNYLGQWRLGQGEGGWTAVAEASGEPIAARNRRTHELAVNALASEGVLVLEVLYGEGRFERSSLERLAQHLGAELEQLVEHCLDPRHGAWSAADFPLAKLGAAELAALPRELEDAYGLAPLQQGLLFQALFEPDSPAYLEQYAFEFSGSFDRARLEEAWRRAIARNAALRTVFRWHHDGEPAQLVLRECPVPLKVHDLRALDAAAAGDAVAAFREHDKRTLFDLARGPLFRLNLFLQPAQRAVLLFSHHHIILDGWSLPILVGDVFRAYADPQAEDAESAKRRPYRDYIAWLQRQDKQAARRFWREHLRGLERPTRLPIARPAVERSSNGACTRTLNARLAARLQERARQARVTLSVLLQAAWAALLARRCAREDVAFGVTVAGRPAALPGSEDMVGAFTNTVPVCVRLRPSTRIEELFQPLQSHLLAAAENAHLGLSEIQHAAGFGGESPFDTIVVFENYPVTPAEALAAAGGLDLVGSSSEQLTSYPLALIVLPRPSLELRALYRGDLLATQDVEALLDEFTALLEAVADDPAHRPLGQLALAAGGKSARRALELSAASARGGPPRSPLEELVAEVWVDVLGLERVGVDDHFFDRGGHSLLAIRVANRLSAALGRQVPVRALFEAPTVAALALRIADARSALTPIEHLPARDYYALSHSQRRIWFLVQLQGAESAYNIPAAVRLRATLDPARLEAALQRLVERHAVLRTTFITVAGEPMQWVADDANIALALDAAAGGDERARLDDVRGKLADFALEPFNLETGPLLRAQLFRIAEDDHVFALAMHHIVSDGWSMDLLVRELCALYAEPEASAAASRPPLELQYADYAQWQRDRVGSGAFRDQRDYWLQRLGGELPALQLPLDRPRPALHSFNGSRHTLRTRAPLLAALRRLCAERGVTLFMLLFAAYQCLLARISGQTDIVVGTPVAGRQHPQIEGLVGLFVNVLALRTDLSDNPRFLDLLERVRESTLQAYANQDYPFDLLVDELRAQRDLSRQAVFNTTFVLQMSAFAAADAAPAALAPEPVAFEFPRAKFDLGVSVVVEDTNLAVEFEYNSDLFERETIARLADCYATLLEGIVADPTRCVAALPLLDASHRDRVLHAFNRERADYVMERDLATCFREHAGRAPQRTAVVCGEESITYGELDQRSERLAGHLLALGLAAETPVALCLERSIEQIVAILGVLKAGGCYLPIEPDYPDERLEYMVRDARCRFAVGRGATAARLAAHVEHAVCLERDAAIIDGRPARAPARAAGTAQLAYIIYTSGSTGRPKGTLLTHANVLRLFRSCERHYRFGEEDVWTLFHSYCFDFSVWEIFGALLYGGQLVIVPALTARSPHELMDLLQQHGVTVFSQTPSAFIRLLDGAALSDQWDWSAQLRYVVFGGEALEYAALRPWYRKRRSSATALVNMYGITETTVHVTYREIAEADVVAGQGRRRVGRALSDLTLYVLDAGGQPQPIGVAGELYVGGAGLARGYLGQPALTAERFVPDAFGTVPGGRLYRTGDRARLHADGEIEYLGRLDQQVKIRGYRIEPGEIEATLLKHASITGALVTVVKDRGQRENLVAYYCAPEPVTTSALRAFLGRSLPDYMVPFAFVHLHEFPLTANGKIDRSKLLYVHGERPQLDVPYVAPRNGMERTLAEMWCEVLQVERVGVQDNFFDLGGESFSAYRLMARISEEFGKELPLAAIFQTQTIERMGERVAEAVDPNIERALVVLQPGVPGRLPFFCVHPAGGDVFGFQDLARALGPDQPFYGVQSLVRFLDDPRHTSLEEMAKHYVAEILSVQPQGPYLIGGHSLGAIVSFEMARQLEDAGHAIGLLAIIDGGARIESSALLDTLLLVSDTFELGLTRSELGALPENEMMSYLLLKAKKRFSRVLEIAYDLDILPRGFRTRDAELFLSRIATNLDLAVRYRAKPLKHRLHLFYATEITENGKPVDVELWRQRALGGVEVIKVPGNHVSLVKKPHAAVLAARLRELIDGVHQGPVLAAAARVQHSEATIGATLRSEHGYRPATKGSQDLDGGTKARY